MLYYERVGQSIEVHMPGPYGWDRVATLPIRIKRKGGHYYEVAYLPRKLSRTWYGTRQHVIHIKEVKD